MEGQCRTTAICPEDGLEVIATGKLTTYPGRSSYQIVADRLELAGEGALMLLFEKLKARLASEGLFMVRANGRYPICPGQSGSLLRPPVP